jgi:hypothetical protein
MNRTDVAIPKTVINLIADRDKAVKHLQDIQRSMDLLRDVCQQAGPYIYPVHNFRGWRSINEATTDLDRSFWRRAMSVTGFDKYMDKVAREQFEKELDRNPPEFNEGNVRSTLIDAMLQADTFMNRGIVELFRNLSGNYKTNDAFKVGRKIILQRWFTVFCGDLSVNYQAEPEMNDLDRILCVLDGSEFKEYQFSSSLRKSASSREFENGYLSMKMFKNGNAHLTFKRLDLIDRVNEIIAEWYGENAIAGKNKY